MRTQDPERRWFVSFRPSRTDTMLKILKEHCATADQRAADQYENYIVCRDPSGLYFHLFNILNGETYECTLGHSCDCMQALNRTNGTSAYCKHDGVTRLHLRLGLVGEFEEPTPPCDREGRVLVDPTTGEVLDPESAGDLAVYAPSREPAPTCTDRSPERRYQAEPRDHSYLWPE